MATTFEKQIESINAAALFFGSQGFHVEVSIHGSVQSADLTIFYSKKCQKKDIGRKLSFYQYEGDVIEHKTFPAITATGKPFYTWKLRKEEL